MTKKTKRKGFTAIEMLVVIAIIAGLVSITVPVVGNQTVKSKAATNAANLRTIESAIALKMVENPDAFAAYFENGGGHKEISDSALGKIYDFFFGEGESGELADKYLLQYADTNTDGTTISINGTSPVVTIPGVALARVMEAPRRDGSTGLVINPGADEYMSAYITEEGVLAFYGNYTKEDFADVAEDGYYDGSVSAGGGGNSGGIQGWIETGVCKLQGKHAPGPGCKCLICGEVAHLDADKDTLQNYNSSTSLHECRCGEVFIAEHIYEGTDHKCKYKKNKDEACDKVTPCEDLDPQDDGIFGIGGDKADHKCYLCGGDNNHAWCTTDEKGGGSLLNPKPDHKCDVCGYVMSTCTFVEIPNDATQHKCSKCEATATHTYANGVCTGCGKTLPTCKFGCGSTDVQKDGYCSSHQEKSCTAKVWRDGLLWDGLVTCSGKYRESTADCSNVGSHVKCGICGTADVQSDGYCSEHQEKTCTEKVLKSGGGTKNCGTKYRTTCDNVANHHTTHTYTNTGDAAQHHCACGAAQNHSYDSNGKCTCGATKTKCQFIGGCNSFDVLADGYCSTHQNLDRCDKHGKSGNNLTDCVLMSRDPNATCTAQHYKYGTCGCNESNRSTTILACRECDHRHTKNNTCTTQVVVPE